MLFALDARCLLKQDSLIKERLKTLIRKTEPQMGRLWLFIQVNCSRRIIPNYPCAKHIPSNILQCINDKNKVLLPLVATNIFATQIVGAVQQEK